MSFTVLQFYDTELGHYCKFTSSFPSKGQHLSKRRYSLFGEKWELWMKSWFKTQGGVAGVRKEMEEGDLE